MDTPLFTLTVILLLLVANAFFVAAEFALVKVRHMRVAALAEQGSGGARMTLRIKEQLEAYLAACQLGITMASLGLGWVGEPFVAALLEPAFHNLGLDATTLHTASFLTGFVIFSSLHIVIGEQVPKTYAIRKPEPVSLWIAWPLHGFYLLAWPLNVALNWSSRSLLRLLNVAEAGHEEVFSGEELSEMIDTSRDAGHIEQGKAEMLKNLFDFDQRTVREVMRPRGEVDLFDLEEPVEALREVFLRTGHSRFPVVRGGTENLLGLLLIKDLFSAEQSGQASVWENLETLVRPALIVPDNIGVSRLFDSMKSERSHMALVVDEYGAFAGIVTLEDLLEEIVGEIHDELDDEPEEDVLTEAEDGWTTTGLANLRHLDRLLGTTLNEHPDANTLTGYFMAELGHMPKVGDELSVPGYHLTILSLDGRRVGKVHIAVVPAGAEAADQTGLPSAETRP